MRIINLLLSAVYFLSCNQAQENSTLKFETLLRGTYNLPQKEHKTSCSDNVMYFLIEATLSNITNSDVRFITFTCATVGNVIIDTKSVETCVNYCSNTALTMKVLKAGESLHFPMIIQTGGENIGMKVKLGWIYVDDHGKNILEIRKIIETSNIESRNIIWSEPIDLGISNWNSFEIVSH